MNTTNIKLHIDQLVLHGFDTVNRRQLSMAVQQELARLCAEHGIPPSNMQPSHTRRLDAGQFEFAANAGPQAIGNQIAKTVFNNIGGSSQTTRTDAASTNGTAYGTGSQPGFNGDAP